MSDITKADIDFVKQVGKDRGFNVSDSESIRVCRQILENISGCDPENADAEFYENACSFFESFEE